MKIKNKKLPSQQNLMAQRMPARVYVDKKKKQAKSACRSKKSVF